MQPTQLLTPPAATERVTDAAIVAAVRAMLHFNPRVRSAETLVQVLDGVVTLAGTVRNLCIRQGAEQDARHVMGVANVHNLLKVRPAQLVPDEEIRQTVVAALGRDPYVGHLPFGVQVHGGQALLTGRVDTHFELERAGDVAAGANGVVGVHNQLAVAGAAAGLASASAPRNPDRNLVAQEAHEAGAHEVNNHLLVLNTDPRINHQTPVEHGIEA
ncbi:BON domain-containing protein [Hymenobacter artigasi]|uniref:Osmotically-inducible protein OsmY n=1 Tax=Hymenobacter artigasi TaxID=2719616 RepID=A0ABX1HDX7_9BACT|nr:BON domain-containing protein [Hymenobacter artigasi]NKI88419.1 osmotically-inducible protein OsmY [Hymenobacter artigasi]